MAQKGAQQPGPEKPTSTFYLDANSDAADGSKMSKPHMNRQFGVPLKQ